MWTFSNKENLPACMLTLGTSSCLHHLPLQDCHLTLFSSEPKNIKSCTCNEAQHERGRKKAEFALRTYI